MSLAATQSRSVGGYDSRKGGSSKWINGAHVVIYSTDPEADRAFFRDILGFPSVDAGHGWLIFSLPTAEAAFHPADGNDRHELYVDTRTALIVRKLPKFGCGYHGYGVRYDQEMRLNGAMIYVKDLPRMVAFYEMSLGLKPIKETRMDTWIEFDTGGSCFALHAIPAPIASQIEVSSPPQPRESNPVKLIFEVEDLEMEVNRLKALGLSILPRPWGTYDGIDPEGNIFQITSFSNGR